MITRLFLSAALAALSIGIAYGQQAPEKKITKCQDAQGRWHYGDSAAEACKRSKITVINDKGLQVKETAAPLTEQEIKMRELNKTTVEDEKKRTADQEKKDNQLLATYAVEADIIIARDRKVADIDTHIRAANDTLSTLRAALGRMQTQAAQEQKSGKPSEQLTQSIAKTQTQIEKHEAAIKERQKEQEDIKRQYQADLERYRELRSGKAKPQAAAK